MTDAPGVTAVVLSVGETTTARAIDSVARQNVAVNDIVLVEGVSPFHRALNEGVTRVRTPFFIQVDADMVLDADCIERLTACLADTVGLVVGHLRDRLYGRVVGIKLFRTECVRRDPFRDSIAHDTDFANEIGRQGWATVYALRYHDRLQSEWHTLGEHHPEYTPLYTYAKHAVEGRRLRYRQDAGAVRYHMQALHKSVHAAALIAQIALGHGLFLDYEGDLQGRYREDRRYRDDPDFVRLSDFLGCRGSNNERNRAPAAPPAPFPKTAFRRGYRIGISLARAKRADRFEHILASLHDSGHPWSWLMAVGLCHGIFADGYDSEVFEAEWAKLRLIRLDSAFTELARYLARALRMQVHHQFSWRRGTG